MPVTLWVSSRKNLLPPASSSFTSVEVFHDCSGGNSRPSRPSGVGGGTFLKRKRKRPTLNVQHSISNAAVRGRFAWPIAVTLVVLILAAITLIIFLRVESWPARTAAQSTAG